MTTSRFPAAPLAACIVGLVLAPIGYVATGALGDFAPAFAWGSLGVLAIVVGFLLARWLRAPAGDGGGAARALEWLGVAAIVGFLAIVSGARLTRGAERVGIAAGFVLAASAIALALVLPRRSALEARLGRLPRGAATAVLVAVVVLALGAVTAGMLVPSRLR